MIQDCLGSSTDGSFATHEFSTLEMLYVPEEARNLTWDDDFYNDTDGQSTRSWVVSFAHVPILLVLVGVYCIIHEDPSCREAAWLVFTLCIMLAFWIVIWLGRIIVLGTNELHFAVMRDGVRVDYASLGLCVRVRKNLKK